MINCFFSIFLRFRIYFRSIFRCKELENIWESAGILLRNVNVQAVIVEYLIRYVDIIFSRKLPIFATCPQQAHGTFHLKQKLFILNKKKTKKLIPP